MKLWCYFVKLFRIFLKVIGYNVILSPVFWGVFRDKMSFRYLAVATINWLGAIWSIFGGHQRSGLKVWHASLKMLTNHPVYPTTLTSMDYLYFFHSHFLFHHNPSHHTEQRFLLCLLLKSRPLPVRLFTLAMSKSVARGVGTPQLFHRGGVTILRGAGPTTHTLQIKWQMNTSKQLLPACRHSAI